MAPSRRGSRLPRDSIPAAHLHNSRAHLELPLPAMEMAPGIPFPPIFQYPDNAISANQGTVPLFREFLGVVGVPPQESTRRLSRVSNTASAAHGTVRGGIRKKSKRSVHPGVNLKAQRPSKQARVNFGAAKPFRSTGLRSFPGGKRSDNVVRTPTTKKFIVGAILEHKQENNCFKFRARADSSVNWFPTRRFVSDDGSVNDVWLAYATKEGLFRDEDFLREYRRLNS